jgi:hypothetical protein
VLTHIYIPFVSSQRRSKAAALSLLLASFLAFSSGCSRFHQEHHDTVYVFARQMYLRDRVAPVSNRVGQVENGQKLEVLEHGRRFLKVKTAKNEIGWLEERAVIDSKTHDAFDQLGVQHKDDPVIATGAVRDDVYLHLTPGRETDRFYMLVANAKIQLLARATVAKAVPGSASAPKLPAPKPATAATPTAKTPGSASKSAAKPTTPLKANGTATAVVQPAPPPPEPPQLEDWWLVRDGQGHSGWLLSGRLDVDVPDEIGTYAEGQRYVGVYVLNKVFDAEATTPDHQVPQYLTVLSPPKSGLAFDFDQVRVFTWSTKRHRYETAFRLHPIKGYLPVRLLPPTDKGAPVFNFQIANGENLMIDPATGMTRPASPRTITYMMIDTQVRRTGSDMGPIPVGHLESDKEKAAKAKAAKKNGK